ncbi:hypothetical protein [Ascidiimonas sp. W6]|uniref:hypothetical protein n=1 Tax=Ascidiimonas meishanensis TaxID=3128903 RepID=UPI0030EE7966
MKQKKADSIWYLANSTFKTTIPFYTLEEEVANIAVLTEISETEFYKIDNAETVKFIKGPPAIKQETKKLLIVPLYFTQNTSALLNCNDYKIGDEIELVAQLANNQWLLHDFNFINHKLEMDFNFEETITHFFEAKDPISVTYSKIEQDTKRSGTKILNATEEKQLLPKLLKILSEKGAEVLANDLDATSNLWYSFTFYKKETNTKSIFEKNAVKTLQFIFEEGTNILLFSPGDSKYIAFKTPQKEAITSLFNKFKAIEN